jgi:hypothetical protein
LACGADRAESGIDLVAALLRKVGGQVPERLLDRAGGQHLDVRGNRRAGNDGEWNRSQNGNSKATAHGIFSRVRLRREILLIVVQCGHRGKALAQPFSPA